MRMWLVLLVLFLVGCELPATPVVTVPPTIEETSTPVFEPTETSTSTATPAPTETPEPTATAEPTETVVPTPTPIIVPGVSVSVVVHNPYSYGVRVRDCFGLTPTTPLECPQAVEDGNPRWLPAGGAMLGYRVIYPFDDATSVWVSVSLEDKAARYWVAVCSSSTPISRMYPVAHLLGETTDLLNYFFNLLQANSPRLGAGLGCHYPQG